MKINSYLACFRLSKSLVGTLIFIYAMVVILQSIIYIYIYILTRPKYYKMWFTIKKNHWSLIDRI